MSEHSDKKVILIGAGPAGLTAAYELCKAGVQSVVLEKDMMVGGLAKTVNYKGYLFDIGGHRFFTKIKSVQELWHEILPDGDFLLRNRVSRIYYDEKFFEYPLHASNALFSLGLWESFRVLLSYFQAQCFPERPEETFEQWVSNRFGKRLYKIFFKTYTEKVWGIDCSEITADWAAQRIKGLSLLSAITNAVKNRKASDKDGEIRTLIHQFHYPRQGPGMMWERAADLIKRRGSQIRLEAEVKKIFLTNNKVDGVGIRSGGQNEVLRGTDFISSMPIRELVQRLDPPVPEKVLSAAMRLNYRDFLTVALIVNKPNVFSDNWIYIHDSRVKVGRIQNFKNWSPDMVPDTSKTVLGLEYFCFQGDGLWNLSDRQLIELGKREMEILGLVLASDVEDGTVVRVTKAYPVYDSTYRQSLEIIRQFLKQIDNLQLVGRNGMHQYNNQDHSMLTAMLAVRNILGANYDLWAVNADQEYHEDGRGYDCKNEGINDFDLLASTQPLVPERRIRPSR